MDRLNHSTPRGRPVSTINAAKATDAFEHFISAGTLKTILFNYQNLCEFLHLKPNVFPLFYPKLKSNLNSWKAKALWKKFDSRVSHKCYARGKACPNTRVLIIGAGPCGLRTAIEAQLLGAKVVSIVDIKSIYYSWKSYCVNVFVISKIFNNKKGDCTQIDILLCSAW